MFWREEVKKDWVKLVLIESHMELIFKPDGSKYEPVHPATGGSANTATGVG